MFWNIRTGIAGLALAVPLTLSASVVPQESNSETRIRPSVSDAARFTGEMDYVFDTALNKTSARFKTSLARGNAFFRVLAGPPPVHTLIADYEFAGRTPPHPPDAIRVSLMSSEFVQSPSEYRPSRGPEPVLVVTVGDRVGRYALGIAQKIEEIRVAEAVSQVAQLRRGTDPRVNSPQSPSELHIERTATARIPICDFLALVHGGSVHGTVAGLEFDLNDDVVAGLRQFAAEMASASTTSPGSAYCK